MMRISTVFFCLLLAAAAAGRYKAEAGVRADKAEIERIEQEIAEENSKISQLDLQVEVLTSSDRLTQLALRRLELTSVKPNQLRTAEDIALALAVDLPEDQPVKQHDHQDFIVDAIAMADFAKLR